MDKQISFRDITGRYRIEGKGDTLVLLHGFCEDLHMWDGIIDKLSAACCVIRPDLPGFGDSEQGAGSWSMEDNAEYVSAILHQEKQNAVVMMGHSMGGYISAHYLEKYPEMVKGLGFINSHVFADSPDKVENRKKSIDFINRNGASLFVRELFNNLFDESFYEQHPQVPEALIQKALSIKNEVVSGALQAMMERRDMRTVLKGLSFPVLFVIGKNDKTIPFNQSIEQTQFPPVADICLMNNAGHMSVFEMPDQTASAILNYMTNK